MTAIQTQNVKWIEGLFRTKKYGKWRPFKVGVANEQLEDHELRKRVIFQIKQSDQYDEELENGRDIVEIKIIKQYASKGHIDQ